MATDRDPRIEVRVVRPDDDLDAHLDLAERAFGVKTPEERETWLQTIDAAAAIAARGFPAAVSVQVPLLITDAARPANSGHWELAVSDGKGSLSPLTPGHPPAVGSPLTLGPRGLAAMYAGAPLISLRQAGLASGGSPEDDAALEAAFAAASYMLDGF